MHSIQLSIPTPCHQNWDKMTPTEQGRFCNACAKQVVDFTTMSDGEVLNYFITKKDENVCGRTLPNQLNRILEAPKPIVPNKLWYWKYAAAAGLLLIGKEGVGQSMEQFLYNAQTSINDPYKHSYSYKNYPIFEGKNAIKGYVTDEKGVAIPFASIKVLGKESKTIADANGFYFIRIDISIDQFSVTASGYESKTLNTKNLSSFDIKLKSIERSKVNVQNGLVGRVGGISIYYAMPIEIKNTAVIKIKDLRGKILNDVSIVVKKNIS
jgi:hypothetical protein